MCWVVQQQGQWLLRLLQPLVLALGCLICGKSNLSSSTGQMQPLGFRPEWSDVDLKISNCPLAIKVACGGNVDDQGAV